ncbi:MAG: helix-turn-helix transcriptional regulator [Anaerolineae bacterium]|nr:helix-turn-helix transcriptional regulator [Anaerolineae bacterium]
MNRELLLLGLLRQQDMHGYQLHEFINRNMSSCIDLKKPTAYYLLEKMVEAGWINEIQEHEGNRPPRNVFQLTAEGEATFQKLLRENIGTYHSTQFADDIGLAFLDALTPDEARALLNTRRDSILRALADAQLAPKHSGTSQLVIDHLIHHLHSELEWLDQVIKQITSFT